MTMAVERKREQVQENGNIVSSTEARPRLGRNADAPAQTTGAAHEVPRTPQEIALFKALDEIGAALREQGLTLEDMIERGREIRRELVEEMYGLKSDADDA
jgi:hypothetical protein